jgi:hypothetical protein
MKTNIKVTCATAILSVASWACVSVPNLMAQTVIIHPPAPPVVVIHPPVPPPPPVVVVSPPAVTVDVVPDSYVWDGQEYVGVVGDTYVYLGPHDVWLPMPQARIAFFHDWEGHHRDWREHAVENERYRLDAHGKTHPWKDNHVEHDHAADHDRGHDHDHDK